MGYFAYFIALVMMLFTDTSDLSAEEGIDQLLDTAVGVNQTLFWGVLIFWGIGLVLGAIFGMLTSDSLAGGIGCGGCLGLFYVILPIIHLAIWQLNIVMANSWDASGATDPVKFGVALLITILIAPA